MLRNLVGHELVPPEEHFRWRGGEITRLEGFTDAVFAFAVTLLVVSLEVPHTYAELVVVMKGFFAFAICFAMLVQVWYYHYLYSRRYGLQTTYTYRYAYSKRSELQLSEYERLRTLHAIFFQLGFAGVGVLVIVTALLLPVQRAGYAGILYSLNGVVGFAFGSVLGKRERLALDKMRLQPATSHP